MTTVQCSLCNKEQHPVKRKVCFHGGYTISVPCFGGGELRYLFLAWLLVSTTVAKSAISQGYHNKQGLFCHDCMKDFREGSGEGFFSQRQDNSCHFIDGTCLICKAELLPLQNVPCARELGHGPFLNMLQLMALYQTPRVPFWMPLLASLLLGLLSSALKALCAFQKSCLVALKRNNWWLTQSVGGFASLGKKISHNFLSRTYGHTSDSCWQHRGNLRSELSQKWFFSYPSASSERTASVGQWVACIAAAGSTLPMLWMKTCVARPGLRFLVVEET